MLQTLKRATSHLKGTVTFVQETYRTAYKLNLIVYKANRIIYKTNSTVHKTNLTVQKACNNSLCKTRPKMVEKRIVPCEKSTTFTYGLIDNCLSLKTDGN